MTTYIKDGIEFCKACRANISQERTEHDRRWEENRGRWLAGFSVAQRHRQPSPHEHLCNHDAVVQTSLAYRAMLQRIYDTFFTLPDPDNGADLERAMAALAATKELL